VFVTTQHLEEAECCDTVAILNSGRLAAVGSPEALRRRALGGESVTVDADGITKEDVVALLRLRGVERVEWDGPRRLRLTVDDARPSMPAVTETLRERGADVHAVAPEANGFDRVFMRIVGAA